MTPYAPHGLEAGEAEEWRGGAPAGSRSASQTWFGLSAVDARPRRLGATGRAWLYRPGLVRHLEGAYAARAAGESCAARMARGGLKPCRWISQVVL